MGFLKWVGSQLTGVVDKVQGNDLPLFDYVWDVSPGDIASMRKEAEALNSQAQRVEEYSQALCLKASAVSRIVDANVSMESAIAKLAISSSKSMRGLAPKRREFRKVDRNFQRAALRVREQGTDVWRCL